MATVNDEAARRSQLALTNQMEMLTFTLTDLQLYGINVFKILQIIECPRALDRIPRSHDAVVGVIDFRGKPVTVIDLSAAVGFERLDYREKLAYIVVCEYNNDVTGFLVLRPDSLLTRGWDEIHRPAGMLTRSASLTAIAYGDQGETVQLLDIEKILADVVGIDGELSKSFVAAAGASASARKHRVLVVDDSRTARMMVMSVLEQIGVEGVEMESAVRALEYLNLESGGTQGANPFSMIISDIEMPGMDGFTFTRSIREIPRFAGSHIVLHSSMSNDSNRLKAQQVGADDFLSKFLPDELARKILDRIAMVDGEAGPG
jgi:two-component system chemotaxis response regulator CheV